MTNPTLKTVNAIALMLQVEPMLPLYRRNLYAAPVMTSIGSSSSGTHIRNLGHLYDGVAAIREQAQKFV